MRSNLLRETEVLDINSERLALRLRRSIEGEVRFDPGSCALYATDASNYRQVPIGVVVPKTVEDVIATVATAREFGAPILARGGGTSLAGQCCNVAVVLDMSKYLNRVISIDTEHKHAVVEPGVVLDKLRHAANQHGLTFGPDPATHTHCTLGGMIGNNSCGIHSVMAGRTSDNVDELDILTYRGDRMTVGAGFKFDGESLRYFSKVLQLRNKYQDLIRSRFPKIPRRVSGYNLLDLLPENGFHVARSLVGSESTCILILRARVNLVHNPPARSLLVLGYPDVYEAGDHIPEILEFKPIGLEGMDDVLVAHMEKKGMHPGAEHFLPKGGGWLLVEFGGETKEEADSRARRLMKSLLSSRNAPTMKLYDNPGEEKLVWGLRESGLGSTARVPGEQDTWEGWEDSAVPVEKVGEYLRDLRTLFKKFGYACALYGHLGQGCVHTRIDFDLKTAEGVRKFRSFIEEASDLVVNYGGSFSGEHGDGQSRAELLPKMYGPELIQAFREFKTIWDPDWKMNPGKIVDPYRLDENLRFGASYSPPDLTTQFEFSDDNGSFAYATERCVGVGNCRQESGGYMCPSYMVTREEMHSTRGRAHLLFEMLHGDPIQNGWRDHHVKEALDLCLACKGCKGECPVNVDMATYKAEFLSHYYEGRLRPLAAYTMGYIHIWARLASWIPELVNFVTQAPITRSLAKLAGGIAMQREIPRFATQTFQSWFRRRATMRDSAMTNVIVWPDTFTNRFHPEIGQAAVELLEDAGFKVRVPQEFMCCGRPLYDYGLLDTARKQLLQILETLREEIRAGIPLVVLEPSCAAVFRDELLNLFPRDEDARRLSRQTFVLSEFLEKKAPDVHLPKRVGRALVQIHCHHAAIIKKTDEKSILEKLGLECEFPDSGCCGMAGSFGFERGEKYDVSVKAGERSLLPRIREAGDDTIIIADGFSCREQIHQGTNRKAVHLAEVIHPVRFESTLPSFVPVLRTAAFIGTVGALAATVAAVYARRSS